MDQESVTTCSASTYLKAAILQLAAALSGLLIGLLQVQAVSNGVLMGLVVLSVPICILQILQLIAIAVSKRWQASLIFIPLAALTGHYVAHAIMF